MKKLLLTLCCLMAAAASAQEITVIPTTGTGKDAFHSSDKGTASVQQNVNLILPQRTALHLDVTELNFDLSKGVGASGSDMACVYGNDSQDKEDRLGENFWNQLQVLPNGVYYAFEETPPDGDWATHKPKITLKNAKGVATSYPPIQFDSAGELVAGSKNNFVCFKTFILQKFSNVGNFKLTVTRDDPRGDRGHHKMYIQDNSCFTINAGLPTGLYALPVGSTRELLPVNATRGTTGSQAEDCGQDHKSWLDDLVVIAIKINGDLAGKSTAALTYTLESKASAFAASDGKSGGEESY